MSFLSVEPEPRLLLESHTNNLLAQFGKQFNILTDRYLVFFQERRSIEATYMNALRNLYRKAKIIDASFDLRAEPTTTREAWDNVRDNLEREANTQQAFVEVLDGDVIRPLTGLKESNDRTRKGIEEDLKESAAQYADYAENTISKLAQSEDVSDDDCRSAVCTLNELRFSRVETLREGYDWLEGLVFTPTLKDVLLKYMNGMIAARTKHDELARSTRAKVDNALAGKDTSDLRASFRRAFSFSIPPPILYRNYRTSAHSDSNLIFGVPLLDLETDEDKIPKVMRMCIEEVERRGLNTRKIYSSRMGSNQEVLALRHRFETGNTFSFSSADSIHSIGNLLMLYLQELPEPLFMLSLQDCRHYAQNRTTYTEDGFSLLQVKIRELHPVQRATLGALLRHLLRVASHSDTNAMGLEALIWEFCNVILGGNAVHRGNVLVKRVVLRDLIRNANTLFDEPPSTSPRVPSPQAAETTSTFPSGSFLSAELSQPSEVDVIGSTSQHRPANLGAIPTSTQSSFPHLPSHVAMENPLTPSPTTLPSSLLGLLSSNNLVEGVQTPSQVQVIPEMRGTSAAESLVNSPPGVVFVPPTFVNEWWLRQSQLPPQPEAMTIPQSPPESVLSGTSDIPLSSVTSL